MTPRRSGRIPGSRCGPTSDLGPSGWLGLDLDAHSDWIELAELLDASYRVTAPRRLVRELDAHNGVDGTAGEA